MTSAPAPGPAKTPNEIVVRELRWTDFDPIRETFFRLFDEREVNPELGITLFDTRPSLEEEVTWFANLYRRVLQGEAVVAVAERAGAVVGHCTVSRVGPAAGSEAAHVGELGILVDREHRGKGVGRALLADALRQCRGKFEVVRLSVFSVNVRARRLYEEFGFVGVGHRAKAVHRGDRYFDEDLMQLDLARFPVNP
jgi:RimJ/RimL family protein N-acetyltransferase